MTNETLVSVEEFNNLKKEVAALKVCFYAFVEALDRNIELDTANDVGILNEFFRRVDEIKSVIVQGKAEEFDRDLGKTIDKMTNWF